MPVNIGTLTTSSSDADFVVLEALCPEVPPVLTGGRFFGCGGSGAGADGTAGASGWRRLRRAVLCSRADVFLLILEMTDEADASCGNETAFLSGSAEGGSTGVDLTDRPFFLFFLRAAVAAAMDAGEGDGAGEGGGAWVGDSVSLLPVRMCPSDDSESSSSAKASSS